MEKNEKYRMSRFSSIIRKFAVMSSRSTSGFRSLAQIGIDPLAAHSPRGLIQAQQPQSIGQ